MKNKTENKNISHYKQNTAGSSMIFNVPKVKPWDKIKDVESYLKNKIHSYETIDYIYVIDDNNILRGVFSIKELFRIKDKEKRVAEIMITKLITVLPNTPQERVVYLALSNKIKSIPVVDEKYHFLGIIPYDAILNIFNREVREDVFKFGGIVHKVDRKFTPTMASAFLMVKLRFPWLIVGILGGTIAASIVSTFENVLNKYIVLAAFMPVLVYMSDAAGTQSETLIVRALAINPELSVKRYLLREAKVAAILSSICGFLIYTVALIGWKEPKLGLIVGLAMFLSMIGGISISTLFPLIFKFFKLDPAVATGPFATMLSDIVTITIYFLVAMVFL